MKKDFCRICIRTILTYSIIILIICLLKAFNIDYLGTSYLVPILIGVLVSYYTSLIVKYNTKDIYKGISEEELIDLDI